MSLFPNKVQSNHKLYKSFRSFRRFTPINISSFLVLSFACLIAVAFSKVDMSPSPFAIDASIDFTVEAFSDPELISATRVPYPSHRVSTSLSSLPNGAFGLNYHPEQYNWEQSTEDNYRSTTGKNYGQFKSVRDKLDYSYHAVYSRSRQWLQDTIIESMLNETTVHDHITGETCSVPNEPWIVFTAGVMGAGKTHSIRRLHEQGLFPLESFVTVDPDEIRRLMPEFAIYAENNPDLAGKMTRKEAGMIAEILTKAALERGQNVLVDGSLRDVVWYQNYFAELRGLYPKLRLGIIHVTAPVESIFERVKSRAMITGRTVPQDVLLASMEQVPKSVAILQKQVDLFLEIHNSDDFTAEIINVTQGMEFSSLRHSWKQTCAASVN